MKDNKLKLNEEKTEFMIFGTRQQLKHVTIESIHLGEEKVKKVTSARNLGVMMDEHLDMNVHVSHICKICYFKIRNIYKIRKFLSTKATKTLVQAVITSKLDYCNSILYGINSGLIKKLQRVQNSAARLIMLCPKRTSMMPVLKHLHWLPIIERINYKIVLTVYKSLNNLAPSYISNLLTPYSSGRTTRTSNKGLLLIPRVNNTTCGKRSFKFAGPTEWNKVDQNIRESENINEFKKHLKTFLFKKYYNC